MALDSRTPSVVRVAKAPSVVSTEASSVASLGLEDYQPPSAVPSTFSELGNGVQERPEEISRLERRVEDQAREIERLREAMNQNEARESAIRTKEEELSRLRNRDWRFSASEIAKRDAEIHRRGQEIEALKEMHRREESRIQRYQSMFHAAARLEKLRPRPIPTETRETQETPETSEPETQETPETKESENPVSAGTSESKENPETTESAGTETAETEEAHVTRVERVVRKFTKADKEELQILYRTLGSWYTSPETLRTFLRGSSVARVLEFCDAAHQFCARWGLWAKENREELFSALQNLYVWQKAVKERLR